MMIELLCDYYKISNDTKYFKRAEKLALKIITLKSFKKY